MDNDTPASSVFPRWPQNTVLTKLIMNVIICEMICTKKGIQQRNVYKCSLMYLAWSYFIYYILYRWMCYFTTNNDEGGHRQFLFKFPGPMMLVVNVSVDSAILGLHRWVKYLLWPTRNCLFGMSPTSGITTMRTRAHVQSHTDTHRKGTQKTKQNKQVSRRWKVSYWRQLCV